MYTSSAPAKERVISLYQEAGSRIARWEGICLPLGWLLFPPSLAFWSAAALEPTNLVMLYLVSVVISAIFLGRGPSLLAAFAGVLAFDFFLVPPYLTLAVSDTQYIITFVVLLVVSLVISTLTTQVREQADAALRRESQTASLYNLGRDLTSATDLDNVLQIIISHIGQAFGREVAIFLPENGHLRLYSSSPGYQPDDNELAVAVWTFEYDQPAAAARILCRLPASAASL